MQKIGNFSSFHIFSSTKVPSRFFQGRRVEPIRSNCDQFTEATKNASDLKESKALGQRLGQPPQSAGFANRITRDLFWTAAELCSAMQVEKTFC